MCDPYFVRLSTGRENRGHTSSLGKSGVINGFNSWAKSVRMWFTPGSSPGRPSWAQWTGLCPAPIITFRLAKTATPRRSCPAAADLPTGVHNHISTAGAALDPPMTHLPLAPCPSGCIHILIYPRSTFASSTFTRQLCCRTQWARSAPFPPLLLWTKAAPTYR